MANDTLYEVRGNQRQLSLDLTNADGVSMYANLVDDGPSPEEAALANVKKDAVGDVLRTMEPLQAEIFRRSEGLQGRHPESLNAIALSLGIPVGRVQRLRRKAGPAFEAHLQVHPRIAFLYAA